MPHPLETEYGLTALEILDAVSERFRTKVAVDGAVAEVQLGKILERLKRSGAIVRYERLDRDGEPDFTVWLAPLPESKPLKIEVKNIRANEAYRNRSTHAIEALKVELQKTRTSTDPSTRFYDVDQFDIVAVCLGKETKDYREFLFVKAADLQEHPKHSGKLAVMHRVPLPRSMIPTAGLARRSIRPWYEGLEDLLKTIT